MLGGLAAGYGTFAALAGRFLFPGRVARRAGYFFCPSSFRFVSDALMSGT
jgi:hypothetical protein